MAGSGGDDPLGRGMASLQMLDDDGELKEDDRSFGFDEPPPAPVAIANSTHMSLAIAAVAETRGRRPSMEDAFCVCDLGSRGCALGVFDGHAGSGCATYIASRFKERYLEEHAALDGTAAIEEFCLGLDGEFLWVHNDGDDGGGLDDSSGCTGTFALITPDASRIACNLTVGNVGDSRVVLRKVATGETVAMTTDHKPSIPTEHERIRAAGGYVINNRVNGKLAVSRAFGDALFKTAEDPREHKVIAVPDVTTHRLQAGDLVLLCCDGIFEGEAEAEMTDARAMGILITHLASHPDDVAGAARALCDAALINGSTDNCTAAVVMIRTPPAPPPPAPQRAAPAANRERASTLASTASNATSSAKRHTPGESKGSLQLVELTLEGDEMSFGLEVADDPVRSRGVRVSQVVRGGPAHRGWVRPGMHVVAVNGRSTTARTAVLRELMKCAASTRTATLMIRSEGATWAKLRREHVAATRSPSPPRRAVPVDTTLDASRGRRRVGQSRTRAGQSKTRTQSRSATHSRPGRGIAKRAPSPPTAVDKSYQEMVQSALNGSGPRHLDASVPRATSPSPRRPQFKKMPVAPPRVTSGSPLPLDRNMHARSCTWKATYEMTHRADGILDHLSLKSVGEVRAMAMRRGVSPSPSRSADSRRKKASAKKPTRAAQ